MRLNNNNPERLLGEPYAGKATRPVLRGLGSQLKSDSPRTIRSSGGPILLASLLDEKEMNVLQDRGAVGDLCGYYFDQDGEFITSDASDCVIGASIKQFKKCPENIAISYGVDKAKAVLGALRTGVLSSLIIDQPCAEKVLKMF